MTPMRVTHVISSLGHGGAENQLLYLHDRLRRLGVDSRLVVVGTVHDDYDAPEACTVLGHSPSLARLPAIRRGLAQHLAGHPPDVLHSSLIVADMAAAMLSLPPSVRRVATLCNIFGLFNQIVNGRPLDYAKALAANLAWAQCLGRRFDALIAISDVVRRSFLEHPAVLGLRPRVKVVHRGFDLPVLEDDAVPCRSDKRRGLGVGPEEVLLLNVGRHVPQKNQLLLLSAISKLRAHTQRPFKLALAGSGPMTPRLRQRAEELQLRESVLFLGQRTDVPQLLAAADVFVFPSRFEGLGVSALEAAGSGTPCVFSRIPALTEIMPSEDFGFRFEPDSSHDLQRALRQAIDDPEEARRRAQRLQARVRTSMSMDVMVDETLELYRSLVPSSSSS